MHDKKLLRSHYTALRDGIPALVRTTAEEEIRKQLFSLPIWKSATLICGYIPTKSELDLLPIWERAAKEGKDYALPVTVTGASEGRMIFRRLRSFSPDILSPARFGILEPPPSCPELTCEDFRAENTLMILPGLAFDDNGFRIGYGGGYYDRYLSLLSEQGIRITTVGLAFSVCRAVSLSHDPHDKPVNYVIDERKVIDVHG